MTLTTSELLSLLDGKQMTAGRAIGIIRRDEHRPSLPPAQRAFVKSVRESSRRRPGPTPTHPENSATSSRTRRDPNAELSPIELAWLERLPSDPAQVRFEDAVELAALASSVSAMRAPQSARLVNSVWLPIKAHHDRRVAEARLAQAREPLPSLPSETKAALAEALAAQNPGLSELARAAEVSEILRTFEEGRAAARETSLRQAEARIKTLDAEAAQYADTTGEVVSV
jgi:hypothetical protein